MGIMNYELRSKKIMGFSKKRRAGFTLVELLVSIAIFAIIMIAAGSSFSYMIKGRKSASLVQQGTENARNALEEMAKNLRMSTIYSCNNNLADDCSGVVTPITSIEIYNYSQGECIQYVFNSVTFSMGYKTTSAVLVGGSKFSNCNVFPTDSATPPIPTILADYIRDMHFSVTETGAQMGRVTIAAEICKDANCTESLTTAQTTVSLRDYEKAGL